MDGQETNDDAPSTSSAARSSPDNGNQFGSMESEESTQSMVQNRRTESNGSIDIGVNNSDSMPMDVEGSGNNETGSDHDNYSTISLASDDMASSENNGEPDVPPPPMQMVVAEENAPNAGGDQNDEAFGDDDSSGTRARRDSMDVMNFVGQTLRMLTAVDHMSGDALAVRNVLRERIAREYRPMDPEAARAEPNNEQNNVVDDMISEEEYHAALDEVDSTDSDVSLNQNAAGPTARNSRRNHMRLRIQRALYGLQRQRPGRARTSQDNMSGEQSPEPENPIRFDTNLPTEHSYMGVEMSRVPGVNYLDVGQRYYMMIFMHEHIIYPGEVLPFMAFGSIFDDVDAGENGALFGVCFPFMCKTEHDENIYGVTCQIYEKGTDARGNTLIKSRALQRFVAKSGEFTVPLHFLAAQPQMKSHGYVKILPDVYLREPLQCVHMGSMSRFRDNLSMRSTYRRYQAASTAFQPYVYERYSIQNIVEVARKQLAQQKIDTMPTDPSQLSFWLVRNLHFHEGVMRQCFLANSVNQRMMYIGASLKQKESIFTCRYCGHSIANCGELFAMSKHGVQNHYCNSAGYIHETNTVYSLLRNAVMYSGAPSSEFSWFPGYEWRIIVCKICTRHVGWKFTAESMNLVPNKFYGISSSSVRVTSSSNIPREGADIYSHLLRLATTRE